MGICMLVRACMRTYARACMCPHVCVCRVHIHVHAIASSKKMTRMKAWNATHHAESSEGVNQVRCSESSQVQ